MFLDFSGDCRGILFFKTEAMSLKGQWSAKDCSIKILSERAHMFLGMYFFGHRSLLSNRHTAMSIIKELVTDLNPVGICELEFTLAFKG